MEHVAAAQLASGAGAALACVDAPLPAQEGWVRGLLADFAARQADAARGPAPYELMRDAASLSARLPPGAGEWDESLGRAFAGLGPPATRAFKLARASAAATLLPGDIPAVAARLRRLQPLKWAHFTRREAHMAWRLREICAGLEGEGGAAAAIGAQQQGGGAGGGGGGGGGKGPAVVAVVGRQHALALQALWDDKASALWRDEMPREFSPSGVEEFNARAAAEAEVELEGGTGRGGGSEGESKGGAGT
jgi:hypothetical protein